MTMEALSVQEAREKLESLRKERDRLSEEVRTLEFRIKAARSRASELVGGFGGRGEIDAAKAELERAIQSEQDAAKPKVVWLTRDNLMRTTDGDYVVEKVTAKRIYIRKAGEAFRPPSSAVRSNLRQFDRETGEAVEKWLKSRIDVAATLAALDAHKES